MDLPNLPAESPLNTAKTIQELQANCRFLRIQMLAMLIPLVVINLSVNIFMFKQVSLVHKQTVELSQAMIEYQEKTAPQMNGFVNKLREFSRRHPDFNRILAKYFKPANTNTVVLPPSTPASPK